MDFFTRQESARRHTKLLEVYLVLAVLGTIALTYFAVAVPLSMAGHGGHSHWHQNSDLAQGNLQGNLWDAKLFLVVSLTTIAIILGGSAFKINELAGGGSAVAEMLGGELVNSNATDPDKHKLLNVVEEMAIASGTPVPRVYVLPRQNHINAFAAGHSTDDMVICVTNGAMKALTRDELQGVIGHEFSHILNGDMKLNLRLMGLVFGLLCITLFGRILLDTRGEKNPLPLFGLALIIIGGIGVFFGKLIKSAVSRQREFLADASAVQFTRNPEGLATALKKVGGAGSIISDPNAEEVSHFFFANGLTESFLGIFSTHPRLEDRIRALDPAWDGKFIEVDISQFAYFQQEDRAATQYKAPPPVPPHPVRAPQLGDLFGARIPGAAKSIPGVGAAILLQTGAPTAQHLAYAADWRSKLPPELDQAARDPMGAVALIYALVWSRDDTVRAKQLEYLQTHTAPGILLETGRLYGSVTQFDGRARLPLVSLAMNALRHLSPAQFAEFNANIQFIIASDNQLELFEYALQKIVLRRLAPNFNPVKRPIIQFYVLKPVTPDCAVLLSALAYAGQEDSAAIEAAFRRGASVLKVPDLMLLQPADCGLQKVDAALDRLNQTAPQIKKNVLNACAETVAADGVIQESEAELLRAIADTLDCPIPPFLEV